MIAMEWVTEVEKGSGQESGPWFMWSPLQVGRKPGGNDPGDSHEGMWLARLRGAGSGVLRIVEVWRSGRSQRD